MKFGPTEVCLIRGIPLYPEKSCDGMYISCLQMTQHNTLSAYNDLE